MNKTELARTRFRITHWLTRYDMKQSRTKYYNFHALALYLKSLQENVLPALEAGEALIPALETGFEGRLLAFVAKGLKQDGILQGEARKSCLNSSS